MVWISVLFLFFWGQQVLEGLVITTVANVTCIWWTNTPPYDDHDCLDVVRAFKRSITFNLSSIAFGSLFVTAVETLQVVFALLEKMQEHQPFKTLLSMLSCCMYVRSSSALASIPHAPD